MSRIIPNCILIIFFSFFSTSLFGQNICLTPTPTAEQEIHARQMMLSWKAKMANSRLNGTQGAITYLPVKIHVVGANGNFGSGTSAMINSAFASVNKHFASTDIQYFLCGGVDYIDNATYYNFDISQEAGLCDSRDVNNAINVYVVNNISYTGGTNVTGYAYFPSGDKRYNRILMKGFYLNDDKTFAHELGHFFSLYHTFQNNKDADIAKRELVGRSNCTTTGDFICDTPADPYGLAGATLNGCTYSGAITDAQGTVFNPLLNNLMSYYVGCGNVLTTSQNQRILDGWNTRQAMMSSGNYDYTCPPTSVTLPTSLNAQLTQNGIVLNWTDNSANEFGFLIERTTDPNLTWTTVAGLPENTTTFTDGSVASNLTYFYRIRPTNSATPTASVTVSTSAFYCRPTYDFGCTDGEILADFIVNGTSLNNANSGCSPNGYGLVGGNPINITAGANYNFTARAVAGGSGLYYPQHLTIWIDANKDGSFSVNERVFQTNASSFMDPIMSSSFTVPANSLSGITRMRVRTQLADDFLTDGGIVNDPCATYDSGETEDYSLNIGIASSATNTIVTGNPSANAYCAGVGLSLNFTTTGTYNAGNQFVLQMSDATGNNFTNLTSTVSGGSISGILPSTLLAGSGYKVRVVANNPVTTGSASVAFTVNPKPNALANGNTTPVCRGESLNLSGSGGSVYAWTGPNGFNSNLQNPSVQNATPSITGIYTLTVTNIGCTNTASVSASFSETPSVAANANGPICAGGTLGLSATASYQSYAWSGPNSFSSNTQNASIQNVTNAASGVYNVVVIHQGCRATASVNVVIGASNASVVSNSPVCAGGTLSFTASGGSAYNWSGPSFNSNVSNPTIVGISTSRAGSYSVVISGSSCTSTLTVNVVVKNLPSATLTGTQSIQANTSANLSVNFIGEAPFSFSLNNGQSVNNTFNNPHNIVVNPSATTTYNLASVSNECGNGAFNGSATVTVITSQGSVNSISIGTPSFGNAVCTGATFTIGFSRVGTFAANSLFELHLSDANGQNFARLSSTLTGSTLSAKIPDNFTIGANYKFKIVAADPATTSNESASFNIKASPQLLASSNSPVCQGNQLALSVSAGQSYTWTSANGFTSTVQNPTKVASFNDIGDFSVAVTATNGCANVASTNVDVRVNTLSGNYSITNAVSSQNGGTVSLSVNAPNVSSYQWTGPNGFSSSLQNPSITGVSSNNQGLYQVVVQNNDGCKATVTATLAIITPNSVCIGLDLKLILEGPYSQNTGLMSTKLNNANILPGQITTNPLFTPTQAGQPFKNAPWNYQGTEAINSYSSTVTDWVLISFRTDNISNSSTIKRLAGLLLNNGKVELLPNTCLELDPLVSYYLVIEHRNHVAVMTQNPVSIDNNTITFDFTLQDSYTNLNSFGQKRLANGKWVMMAGDGRKVNNAQNNDLNANDSQEWRLNSGLFGKYASADFNLDGDINASDLLFWRINNGKYSGVPK